MAEQDSRFIDVDGMKADYKYNLYGLSKEEKEKGKLNRGETVNADSSKYAMDLLNKTIKEGKVALLSYNKKIIKYIIDNKYEYCLVYANKNLGDEYAKRMRDRGNSDLFVEQMTNKNEWEDFYERNVADPNPTYKIELNEGQYLSDVKDKFI